MPTIADTNIIDCVDVSPKQIISVTTSLIPFLEHDDANRALMGSNMQRQAVSCIVPRAPIVGTGMEAKAARDSGQVITAEEDGEVLSVVGDKITVKGESGKTKEYPLLKFIRTNSGTSMNQINRVIKGQKVKAGDVLVVRPKSQKSEYFKNLDENTGKPDVTASWLKANRKKFEISITGVPSREEAEPDINEQLIVEYYSR